MEIRSSRRPLLSVLALAGLAALLPAQSHYYVDGQLGADVPGNGAAAATPWRTIGYALANVPPQTPATAAVVHVAGGQIYAPATNGETFPLVPAARVAVVGAPGAGGARPVLRVPTGGTGFAFAAGVTYARPQDALEGLIVENGDHGLLLGADPGHAHAPLVRDCEFRGQAIAAVSLVGSGDLVDAPRFEGDLFVGAGAQIGIAAQAVGDDATVAPEVVDCRFHHCSTGVRVEAATWNGTPEARLLARTSNFADCGTGVALVANTSPWDRFEADLAACRFAGCITGIEAASGDIGFAGGTTDLATVDECVFFDCGRGLFVTTTVTGGLGVELVVTRSTFDNCHEGLVGDNHSPGFNRVLLDSVTIDGCDSGIRYDEIGDPAGSRLAIVRSRVLRCLTGIDVLLDANLGELVLDSTLVAQCSIVGIDFDAFPGDPSFPPSAMAIHNSTITDNTVGIAIPRQNLQSAASSTILAYNAQPLQLAAGVTWLMDHCCFDVFAWPGVGNLSLTDPQLVRPFYKLSPRSLCIDAGALWASSTTDQEGDPRASQGRPAGPVLCDIGADEYVLQGSARVYGTPGFQLGGVRPHIAAASPTAPAGAPIQIDLTGAGAATFAILGLGFRDDGGGGPFDLTAIGLPWSYAWIDFRAAFPVQPVVAGAASLVHTIPNLAGLEGFVFTHEWFVLLPTTAVSSDALRVTIGR